MLKNAKKVIKEVADPLMAQISEGMIPNEFLDELTEGVEFKVTSFARKLDPVFTKEFSRDFSEFRQQSWKTAKEKYSREWWKLPSKYLKGTIFVPREDMVLWDTPSETYKNWGKKKISLPNPNIKSFDYNLIESARVVSGLQAGNVSYQEKVLNYNRVLETEDQIFFKDELDELKYIYRAFWHLGRCCSLNWLEVLYLKPGKKIIDYNLASWTPRDGYIYGESCALFSIEGTDLYIPVEDLYDWILHWRTPGKEYAIGECDSAKALGYSLLLEYGYGIPRGMIRERITLSDFEKIEWEILDYLNIHPEINQENKDDDGLPEEWKNMMQTFRQEGINVRLPEEPREEAYEERIIPVDIDLRNINLDFDTGSIDSFSDSSSEMEEENSSEVVLPYHPNLHASGNEYESMYLALDRQDPEENINEDALSDISENMADEVLDPIEALGIDLIDPSRDTTYQPNLRRIGLVWDPGGGTRNISLRYRRN